MAKFVLFSLLLLLSACSGIVNYYSVPGGSLYSFVEVQKAAETGGIYADVVGNSSGWSTLDFRQRVRRLMSGEINGVPIKFIGKSSRKNTPDYRVVVWFNPSVGSRRLNLCTYMGGVGLNEDPQKTEVGMALCSGQTLLSSSSGIFFFYRFDDEDLVKTKLFRDLIKSVTAGLFPIRLDNEENFEFVRWF